MRGSDLKERLRGGDLVLATMVVSPSPVWATAVAHTGLDCVFIDTEHTPLDRSAVAWMCRLYAALGLPPLVRVTAPDPTQASAAFDAGAIGVVFPYVESPEEALRLRGATTLAPVKGITMEEMLSGSTQDHDDLRTRLEERNRDSLAIINIESVPALRRLDEILEVGQPDAVLIGPHDLSWSLGIPEQFDHPDFDSACRRIFRTARAAGIGAGVHCYYGDVDQEVAWATEAGANFIIHSTDTRAFRAKMLDDISRLRGAIGSALSSDGKSGQLDEPSP